MANKSDSTEPSRFKRSLISSGSTSVDDIFSAKVAGLKTAEEYRKCRAEAEDEARSRDARGTPPAKRVALEGESSDQPQKKKKKNPKKKLNSRHLLSFSVSEDEEDLTKSTPSLASSKPKLNVEPKPAISSPASSQDHSNPRLTLNPSVPRIQPQSIEAKQAELRETFYKELAVLEEAVKATEVLLPFVFYDGKVHPASACKVKKGDEIWLVLDKCRKLGAELGLGRTGKSTREWTLIGVDSLMLVSGETIIPHKLNLYHFIEREINGSHGKLFDYTMLPTRATPVPKDTLFYKGVFTELLAQSSPKAPLEGADHNPELMKVVDRQWYNKNKHIYPANIWKEYDFSGRDQKGVRRDKEGNSFFFS